MMRDPNIRHFGGKTIRPVAKRVQYALMRNVRVRDERERSLLKNGPRVLANSIPKAGTNLLGQVLDMMPNTVSRWRYHIDETLPGIEQQLRAGRRGQAITAHFPYSTWIAGLIAELDYRVFLMVRDPRDIALSNVNYVTQMDTSHPLHAYMADLPDDDARLLAMIEPPEYLRAKLPKVWHNDGLDKFLPWLEEPNCMIVRFEDLVGARGGGSDERQLQMVQDIGRHIGAFLEVGQAQEVSSRLFGNTGSKTFHRGQIGAWTDYYNPEHKSAFKRRSGRALVCLGYEESQDW